MMATERMEAVPVKGEGRMNGETPVDIPAGLIDWDEHYLAWEGYVRRYPGLPAGMTPENVARNGGFSFNELQIYLDRNPTTWRLADPVRYAQFELRPEDRADWEEPGPEVGVLYSHIRYGGGEVTICEDILNVPEYPVLFDAIDAPHCPGCLIQLNKWVKWWKQENL